MDNINIATLNIDDPEYQFVYDLREEILRKPIGLSLKDEDLSNDRLDTILVARMGSEIIGCVMLHPTGDSAIKKLRQMAVKTERQGKGIGRMLVDAAEELLHKEGIQKIVLHARETAIEFYEKSGYLVKSDLFTEVGIPHVVMEKRL